MATRWRLSLASTEEVTIWHAETTWIGHEMSGLSYGIPVARSRTGESEIIGFVRMGRRNHDGNFFTLSAPMCDEFPNLTIPYSTRYFCLIYDQKMEMIKIIRNPCQFISKFYQINLKAISLNHPYLRPHTRIMKAGRTINTFLALKRI